MKKTEQKKSGAKKAKENESELWRAQHGLSGARHRAYSTFLRSYNLMLRRVEGLSVEQGALSPEWYDVLLALEYAPDKRLRVCDLACHVTVSRSGLTRLLDRLEAAGLVERKINPTDRRSFEVILTPQGAAERARAWPIYARIIAEVFGSHYTDAEAANIVDLLDRLIATPHVGLCEATPCSDSQKHAAK